MVKVARLVLIAAWLLLIYSVETNTPVSTMMARYYKWTYTQWWSVAAFAQRRTLNEYNKYREMVEP